jgi:hypothetical protein
MKKLFFYSKIYLFAFLAICFFGLSVHLIKAESTQFIFEDTVLFDPRVNKLEINFKDRTSAKAGAVITYEFTCTATKKGLADNGKAMVFLTSSGDPLSPISNSVDMFNNSGAATFSLNDSGSNFELRPDFSALTKAVTFGIVPFSYASSEITNTAQDGFYDANYTTGFHASDYFTYDSGTLHYRVIGDNVKSVSVANSPFGKIEIEDIFDLFSDNQLIDLVAALEEYFGNDSTKVKDFLTKSKDKIVKHFPAIN